MTILSNSVIGDKQLYTFTLDTISQQYSVLEMGQGHNPVLYLVSFEIKL